MSDTKLLLKPRTASEPAPVQRLEVFTGTGRRRRWTPEQKRLIVAETYEVGETVSAVACRHGLTPQQLFTWRREAQRARTAGEGMAFAPVVLEASRLGAGASPIAQNHAPAPPIIEVLIGAATIRIPPGTELASLQVVLSAVTAAA